MAKNSSNGDKGPGDKGSDAKGRPEDMGRADRKPEGNESAAPWDAIPDALREAGRRATDLAQNPYARSLLAAGLVTAAAALAANKNVRETTRRNLKDATDAAEVAADNAGKIGVAIINAATEAVQRMINLTSAAADQSPAAAGGSDSAAPDPAPSPAPKRATEDGSAEATSPKPRAPQSKTMSNAGGAKAASSAKPKGASGGGKSAPTSSSKGAGKKSGSSAAKGAAGKRKPNQDG